MQFSSFFIDYGRVSQPWQLGNAGWGVLGVIIKFPRLRNPGLWYPSRSVCTGGNRRNKVTVNHCLEAQGHTLQNFSQIF